MGFSDNSSLSVSVISPPNLGRPFASSLAIAPCRLRRFGISWRRQLDEPCQIREGVGVGGTKYMGNFTEMKW